MDWLAEAHALAEAGEPFALATVVRRVAPASARPGAKALIRRDGTMRGWVGGSCAQPAVSDEARRAMRSGAPRLLRLGQMSGGGTSPSETDIVEHPMTCHSGGALEILIEPVLPAPHLAVVGETPVAEELAKLAALLGYRVSRLGRAAELDGAHGKGFVVVASMGVDDETALATALRSGAPYVALVASAKRAAAVRETLLASGLSPAELSRLKAPAGLDIGARTQEEIALSILAEIVKAQAAMSPGREDEAPVQAEAAGAAEAIDPVCGMSVSVTGARHHSDYRGERWYFCCGGCKARFDADPTAYAAA